MDSHPLLNEDPSFDASESVDSQNDYEVPVAVEKTLSSMLSTLQHHGIASSEECDHIIEKIYTQWSQGRGADPLEALVQLRSPGGDVSEADVEDLSLQIALLMPVVPLRIPFAGRLITPTSFYEKFSDITRLCQLMMVPITFNEDADVIGITSINPYFAGALSVMIIEELKKFSDITPLITITRIDYLAWKVINEKHFRKVGAYD